MNRVLGAMLVLLLLGALLVLVAFDSNGLVLALSLAVLLLGVAVVRWSSRKRAPAKERNGFLQLTLFGSQALGCLFLLLMGAALAAIAIPNFIRFQAGGGKHSFATRIREAFHLTRRMEVKFNDGLNDQIREEVQIVPIADWSLRDVNLLYAKEQAKTRVVSRAPFQKAKLKMSLAWEWMR
jgi:hypothetical protein